MVYLDHNATTKPTPKVIEAITDAMTNRWGNPSSVHRFGQDAKHAIEVARRQVATLLGVKGGGRGVVFTGSGTEAINLAIRGVMGALRQTDRRVVVTSAVEHSAVRELCALMEDEGLIEVRTVGVDHDGRLNLDELRSHMDQSVGVVSIQWVNNETGVIQDINQIGSISQQHGAIFHCDATQWVGKMETKVDGDPETQGHLGAKIDVLTCSPHKYHGVKGVGILWSRSDRNRRVRMTPVTPGSQELGRRGGTEAVPMICGAGVASEEAHTWITSEGSIESATQIRDRLESEIISRCQSELEIKPTVNAGAAPRVWSATNIGFPGLEAEALILAMSERGLCVSAGAACSSGSLEASPILVAMNVDPKVAHGSIRLSISRETTQQDIDQALDIVIDSVRAVNRSMVGGI